MATGDVTVLPDSPSRETAPTAGLAGPWIAAGLGLAVLALVPNDGATEPAGAAAPPQLAAPIVAASLDPGQALPALPLDRVLSHPGVASAATAIDLDLLESLTGEPVEAPSDRLAFEFSSTPPEPVVWASRSFGLAAPAPTVVEAPSAEQWEALRWCESSNDYGAVNHTGKYRGAYQFDVPTWESVGGVGDPAAASPEEQDRRAILLWERRGAAPWPFCGRHLG